MFPSPCCHKGPILFSTFPCFYSFSILGNVSKRYHQFFWECGNHPPESVSPLIAVGTSTTSLHRLDAPPQVAEDGGCTRSLLSQMGVSWPRDFCGKFWGGRQKTSHRRTKGEIPIGTFFFFVDLDFGKPNLGIHVIIIYCIYTYIHRYVVISGVS